MTTDSILSIIISTVIVPMLAYLITKLSAYLDEKMQTVKNERLQKALKDAKEELETAVYKAIVTTQETYVAALKADGNFSEEDAKLAFQKSVDLATQIMSDAALAVLKDAAVDVEAAIMAEIESLLPTIQTDIKASE